MRATLATLATTPVLATGTRELTYVVVIPILVVLIVVILVNRVF